jgi:hypothetical protein
MTAMTAMTATRPAAPPGNDTGAERTRLILRLTIWDWLCALVVIVVSVTRYSVLVEGGAPPTIDSGNWLAYADQILGSGVRSESIVYPPVVPLLVAGSVAALGLTAGVATIATLAAAVPGIGMYAVLRWQGLGAWALGPALLVLGASSVGEAAAWGGFPQLIGFGLLPIALVLIDRAVRTAQPGHALGAGIATAAIAATSHFVLALTVLAGLALLATGLASRPRPGPAALGLFVLPSLWLAPVYAGLFAGYRESPRESTSSTEMQRGCGGSCSWSRSAGSSCWCGTALVCGGSPPP